MMQLVGPDDYEPVHDVLTPIRNPDIFLGVIKLNNKTYHLPSNTLSVAWNPEGLWNVYHNFIYYDTDNACLSQGYWELKATNIEPNEKSELVFSVNLSGPKLIGLASIILVLRDRTSFMLPVD